MAEEAAKFCEAIQAQHNVQSKKLALTGKAAAWKQRSIAKDLRTERWVVVVCCGCGLSLFFCWGDVFGLGAVAGKVEGCETLG